MTVESSIELSNASSNKGWRAAKASASAFVGPAALAVSAGLLIAASMTGRSGAKALLGASPGAASAFEQVHSFSLGLSGASLFAGALGASAAAGMALFRSFQGRDPAAGPGLKESLWDAWRLSWAHIAFGSAGSALLVAAQASESSGRAELAIPLLVLGAGLSALATAGAGTAAAQNSLAALGVQEGLEQLAERKLGSPSSSRELLRALGSWREKKTSISPSTPKISAPSSPL